MQQGEIKRVFPKGFGFITPKEGGKDLFFHFSNLNRASFGGEGAEPQEGQAVTYDLEEGVDKKTGELRISAINVTLVSAEASNVIPVDFTPEAEEPMAEAA